MEHAIHKLGAEEVQAIKHQVQQHRAWDDREKSIRIVDQLMIRCQELAPATVLLYAPPYYPAINSSNHPLVKQSIELMKQTAQTFDIEVEQIHYFNGI
ncbi:amino acid degradation protein, partial [Lysinibacillus sp. IITD104]